MQTIVNDQEGSNQMNIFDSVRSWLSDPFGRKESIQKHNEIHRDVQILIGQVDQKKKELSRHPYRTLHREFRQKGKNTNVQLYE